MKIIEGALDEAQRRCCQIVNFSGGEPFVLGKKLIEMVRAASRRDLLARITTGAYWSSTPEQANKRLIPLVAAGIRQLFISCSDFHQQFVPLQNAVEGTRVARELGIEVCLVLGVTRQSQTRARTVREAFEGAGLPVPYILESPLIPYGRGSESLPHSELFLQPLENFSGPCASLTKHPTIHSDGRASGCASVFSRDCGPLQFGSLKVKSLGEILDSMDHSPLAQWIHRIGVVQLKRLIEQNSPVRFASRYVNICHLCGDILTSSEALEVLHRLGLLCGQGGMTEHPA